MRIVRALILVILWGSTILAQAPAVSISGVVEDQTVLKWPANRDATSGGAMFDHRNVSGRAALIATTTLLVALTGCRANTVSPVAPSTQAAVTTPFQVALWTVTTTPISVTGAACGVDTSMRSPGTQPMMVELTPQTVDFKPGDPRYWEPLDFYEYTGPRTGASFTARQAYPTWDTAACGATTWETTVVGTFSDDGSHLTAEQVDTFNVGDAHVVRTYSWAGDRQCDGKSPNCFVPLLSVMR